MCWVILLICSSLTHCLSIQRQSGQKNYPQCIERQSWAWSSSVPSEFHKAPILISVSMTQISKDSEGGLRNVREWQWGFWNCSQPSGLMCRRLRPVFLALWRRAVEAITERDWHITDCHLSFICCKKGWACEAVMTNRKLSVFTFLRVNTWSTLDMAECPRVLELSMTTGPPAEEEKHETGTLQSEMMINGAHFVDVMYACTVFILAVVSSISNVSKVKMMLLCGSDFISIFCEIYPLCIHRLFRIEGQVPFQAGNPVVHVMYAQLDLHLSHIYDTGEKHFMQLRIMKTAIFKS